MSKEVTIDIHKKSTIVIVPFSGGVDSTTVLYHTLKKVEDENLDIMIRVLSYQDPRIPQTVRETNARKLIMKKIYKEFSQKTLKKISHVERETDYTVRNFIDQPATQGYWWITEIFAHYGSNFTVLYGYIKNDTFWDKWVKNKNLIKTSKKWFPGEENRKFRYPLKDLTKRDVITMLPKRYLKLVSFCEEYSGNKEYKYDGPCGRCNSCKVILSLK